MPELTLEQRQRLLQLDFLHVPDKDCYVKLYKGSLGTGIWVYGDGDVWREFELGLRDIEEFDRDSEALTEMGILPHKPGKKE